MAKQCLMCERPAGDGAETYTLTEDERKALASLGTEALPEYVYCRACLRVMKDREQGAQFLKGVLLSKMRASGVPQAEVIADKFYKFLIERTSKRPS